jgi:tetratricopeptide (TPR) repeat protein
VRIFKLSLALAVLAGCASTKETSTAVGKKEAAAEELNRLKRDISKVDKSLGVTKVLINRSKGERYLPDLYFRLAELNIEKSRLVYFRILEEAGAEDKAAVQAPEARLLKDQAIAIYRRILGEFPDYPDNDKILFFIAHEYRELGNFDEMINTYKELVGKYPKSSFRFEAWLILGDYHFDKGEIDVAMRNYQNILKNPETYAHNMARYKLGWCWVNKDKPKKAVDLWEKAVKTKAKLEPGAKKNEEPRLGVRREALKDLAFYYAEARNPRNAVRYFQDLTKTREEYTVVLEKLARRFTIKTMYDEAANVYRELIRVSGDLNLQIEWAQEVYNASIQARNLSKADKDVVMLSKISARYRNWWRATDDEKKVVTDFELLARDLSTRLQTFAKERNDPKIYARAAKAYKAYLASFPDSPKREAMEWNYAETLYAAKQFVNAGRQYETVLSVLEGGKIAPAAKDDDAKKGDAKEGDDAKKDDAKKGDAKEAKSGEPEKTKGGAPKSDKKPSGDVKLVGTVAGKARAAGGQNKQALYAAILSYFEALKKDDETSRFDSMMAREGIKYLGAEYVRRYPADNNTPQVKFNVARAYFEQGLYDDSIKLFTAFVKEHPSHKDAVVAAELCLDSFAQKEDFNGLAKAARVFAKAPLPDGSAKGRFEKMAAQAEQEEINRKTLEAEGKDITKALASFIVEKKGTEVAAKALYQAFVIARDRHDLDEMRAAGQQLLDEYQSTPYAKEVLPTLAEKTLRISQVEAAAGYYEEYARRFPKGKNADEFLEGATRIRIELGEFDGAMVNYERLARQGREERQPYYYARLAETALEAGDLRQAENAAQQVLGHPDHGVLAGAIVGQAALASGDLEGASGELGEAISMGNARRGLKDGRKWLGRAQYMLGEVARKAFEDVQFGSGLSDGEVLGAKFEALNVVETVYIGAIQVGDPEWAMGALYRVANAYRDAADFLDNAPTPAGMTDVELEQYRAALQERSGPLRKQADEAVQVCRQKARELKAFNRFVKACQAGAQVVETADQMKPRPRGIVIQGRDRLEAKLAENPKDLNALKGLIRAAIQVNDFHLARQLSLRALEIEERSAELHNLLGVATAGTGRMQLAFDSFRTATKRGRIPEAWANLAVVYAEYGDEKKSREAMNKASGAKVKSADVMTGFSSLGRGR